MSRDKQTHTKAPLLRSPYRLPRIVLLVFLFYVILHPGAQAQIDSEQLINSSCPTAVNNAEDWDTIAECINTGSLTWTRGPFYLGASAATCSGGTNAGLLQWTGTALQYCTSLGWQTVYVSAGSYSSLSSLTQALATNNKDNATYAQTWTWNTLSSQNALTLSTTSSTTGSVLNTSSTNGSSAVGPILNLTSAGIGTSIGMESTMVSATATNSAAGYFNNSSSTGWGVYAGGSSPNYFSGNITVNISKSYQINSLLAITIPAQDTSSIAIGSGSLIAETLTGEDNTAIGANTLTVDVGTSTANTAAGYSALSAVATNSNNSAAGYDAMISATGGNNDGLGSQAGYKVTSGASNTAVGQKAMFGGAAITGSNNTAIGNSALFSIQGAASNLTALGYKALYNLPNASNSTAVGYEALYSANSASSNPNDAFGYQAGYYISSGTFNTAFGYQAMYGVSGTPLTGSANVAIGNSALYTIQGAATADTALGYQALYLNTTGSYNSALGYQALYSNVTSSNNTAVGYQALYSATSGPNDAFGYDAGYGITSGTNNVALGYQAIGSTSVTLTGSSNTAVGNSALYSLQGAATGNTALGYQAGYAGTAITSGTYNTFVGYQTQASGAGAATYTNGVAIGNGAVLTASNVIVLGNGSVSKLAAQISSLSPISDRRLKKDITDLTSDLGLEFITKLKPVSYRFKNGDETEKFGFIAQDLEEALPQSLQNKVETAPDEHGIALLDRENDKDRTYSVNYAELTAPIVKAIQEQNDEVRVNHENIVLLSKPEDKELRAKIDHLKEHLENNLRRLFIWPIVALLCGTGFGYIITRRKIRASQ